MNGEQVSRLYDYLKSEEIIGDRIGIQNVIYRGKMLYGDRMVFEVHSHPGEGTRIVLKIPSNP